MKPMTLVQTAVAAAMILGRTPVASAAGGLELRVGGEQLARIDQPTLFAAAASAAWAKAAPDVCREFQTFIQQITSCDGLNLDVGTSTLDIQTGTPPTTTIGVSLPKIVLHGSWEYPGDLTNTTTNQHWHNPQCAADIALSAGYFFPFRIAITGSMLYKAAGVVEQVGFDTPILDFGAGNVTTTWHAPCGSQASTHPTGPGYALLNQVLQEVLSNVNFPGTVLSDSLQPYAATIRDTLSLHDYTLTLPGTGVDAGNIVIDVGASRLSKVKVENLPGATSAQTSPAGGSPGPGAAVPASAPATAPNWSAPPNAVATSNAAPSSSLRPSVQQHALTMPAPLGQVPMVPSPLSAAH